ncbi:MAG: hypothetical protein U0U69_06490 [Acidimicrobiia bacterium]
MRHSQSRIVVFWFLFLLVVPTAVWLVGKRARPIENKPLAGRPALSLQAMRDGTFFKGLDTFLQEHLPLRADLVQAKAAVDSRVIGESPNPQVTFGSDGWLFFTEDLQRDCSATAPGDVIVSQMGRFVAQVDAAGRRAVAYIGPDKSSMVPDRLPTAMRDTCTRELSRQIRDRLREQDPAGVPDLFSVLDRDDVESLYWRRDSHWNPEGAALASGAVVDAIQPGLWDASAVVVGPDTSHVTDLTQLMGLPEEEASPSVQIRRDGVTTTEVPTADPTTTRHYRSTTTGAPLIGGTTVILHDSFGNVQMDQLAPYFEDVTFVWMRAGVTDTARSADGKWYVTWPGLAAPEMQALMRGADTIVYQSVERAADVRFAPESVTGLLDAAGVAQG